jgi:hypothetical protein
MYHVGFTGTQEGMSPEQEKKLGKYLHNLLRKKAEITLHHGDCVGADAQAHTIALSMGIKVCLHPPLDPKKRAFCEGWSDIYLAKEYLTRNRDIVDASDVLIATPGGFQEKKRSGTWATIRYATCGLAKKVKCAQIIWPDGEMEDWQA